MENNYFPIGIDSEIELFQQKLKDLKNGRGSVIAIEGEGGSGKSFLMTEMMKLARKPMRPKPILIVTMTSTRTTAKPMKPTIMVGTKTMTGIMGKTLNPPPPSSRARATGTPVPPSAICSRRSSR